MKTLEKPLITSKPLVIKVQSYNSVIAMEKASLPELSRRIDETTQKQERSRMDMLSSAMAMK